MAGIASDADEAPPVCAANTDSFRCRSSLRHDGQAGVSPPRTKDSNSLSHDRQEYS
jgi:hypothetical protein